MEAEKISMEKWIRAASIAKKMKKTLFLKDILEIYLYEFVN